MIDTCEWYPMDDRSSVHGEDHADAVWSVGKRPSWHLCAACVELPRFKRFRKRTWIGPKSSTGAQ